MHNRRTLALAGAALMLLVACDTPAPYSNIIDTTGRGVGFSDYAQYMRAQEELSRIRRAQTAQARQTPQQASGPQFAIPAGQPRQTQSIGQEAVAAVRGGASVSQQGATPPMQTASSFPTNAAPSGNSSTGAPLSGVSPTGSIPASGQFASAAPQPAGVSEQQFTPRPFGSSEPDQLVERDFVPQVRVGADELGTGGGTPNLFVYALSTQHNVGQARYNRSHPLRFRRAEAACAQFASQDLAQEAFLAAGGPERDPNHLDPDGDGFACWWDPAPFRQAARTVRARQ